MKLGINLSFAIKRLTEASEWAKFVREELELDLVQFTFDLIDPFTPAELRKTLAEQVRQATSAYDITVHSAFTGLAAYTYNGLLHPEAAGRQAARVWWENAISLTVEMGADAVGGQLGGLSVADAANPAVSKERYDEAFQAWIELSEIAADAGLNTLYIEPTPLKREFPHTIEQAAQMAAAWEGETAIPVRYAVDVGHAIYKPLYGEDVTLEAWLDALSDSTGLLHLQNTDGMSDSHWGWPEPEGVKGTFDVAEFGRSVEQYGLGDLPVFIEVFYPFEWTDEQVLENVKQTVAYVKSELS